MIHIGKLCPVGAGHVLVLYLRPHRRRMLLALCAQFRGPGPHLDAARAAIEAHARAAPIAASATTVHRVVVDVVSK